MFFNSSDWGAHDFPQQEWVWYDLNLSHICRSKLSPFPDSADSGETWETWDHTCHVHLPKIRKKSSFIHISHISWLNLLETSCSAPAQRQDTHVVLREGNEVTNGGLLGAAFQRFQQQCGDTKPREVMTLPRTPCTIYLEKIQLEPWTKNVQQDQIQSVMLTPAITSGRKFLQWFASAFRSVSSLSRFMDFPNWFMLTVENYSHLFGRISWTFKLWRLAMRVITAAKGLRLSEIGLCQILKKKNISSSNFKLKTCVNLAFRFLKNHVPSEKITPSRSKKWTKMDRPPGLATDDGAQAV